MIITKRVLGIFLVNILIFNSISAQENYLLNSSPELSNLILTSSKYQQPSELDQEKLQSELESTLKMIKDLEDVKQSLTRENNKSLDFLRGVSNANEAFSEGLNYRIPFVGSLYKKIADYSTSSSTQEIISSNNSLEEFTREFERKHIIRVITENTAQNPNNLDLLLTDQAFNDYIYSDASLPEATNKVFIDLVKNEQNKFRSELGKGLAEMQLNEIRAQEFRKELTSEVEQLKSQIQTAIELGQVNSQRLDSLQRKLAFTQDILIVGFIDINKRLTNLELQNFLDKTPLDQQIDKLENSNKFDAAFRTTQEKRDYIKKLKETQTRNNTRKVIQGLNSIGPAVIELGGNLGLSQETLTASSYAIQLTSIALSYSSQEYIGATAQTLGLVNTLFGGNNQEPSAELKAINALREEVNVRFDTLEVRMYKYYKDLAERQILLLSEIDTLSIDMANYHIQEMEYLTRLHYDLKNESTTTKQTLALLEEILREQQLDAILTCPDVISEIDELLFNAEHLDYERLNDIHYQSAAKDCVFSIYQISRKDLENFTLFHHLSDPDDSYSKFSSYQNLSKLWNYSWNKESSSYLNSSLNMLPRHIRNEFLAYDLLKKSQPESTIDENIQFVTNTTLRDSDWVTIITNYYLRLFQFIEIIDKESGDRLEIDEYLENSGHGVYSIGTKIRTLKKFFNLVDLTIKQEALLSGYTLINRYNYLLNDENEEIAHLAFESIKGNSILAQNFAQHILNTNKNSINTASETPQVIYKGSRSKITLLECDEICNYQISISRNFNSPQYNNEEVFIPTFIGYKDLKDPEFIYNDRMSDLLEVKSNLQSKITELQIASSVGTSPGFLEIESYKYILQAEN
ncbi:MAG: hypothetical protein RIE52_00300 [Balneola sp.]|jgi:hypothetical protein